MADSSNVKEPAMADSRLGPPRMRRCAPARLCLQQDARPRGRCAGRFDTIENYRFCASDIVNIRLPPALVTFS